MEEIHAIRRARVEVSRLLFRSSAVSVYVMYDRLSLHFDSADSPAKRAPPLCLHQIGRFCFDFARRLSDARSSAPMSALQPARKLQPGEGVVKLARSGQQAVFEEIHFSYPLKLIVPKRHFQDGLNVVYMISYGGGLVAGDRVVMHVEVEKGATLVMLTQGE